jgi:hypothetical protein
MITTLADELQQPSHAKGYFGGVALMRNRDPVRLLMKCGTPRERASQWLRQVTERGRGPIFVYAIAPGGIQLVWNTARTSWWLYQVDVSCTYRTGDEAWAAAVRAAKQLARTRHGRHKISLPVSCLLPLIRDAVSPLVALITPSIIDLTAYRIYVEEATRANEERVFH